MKFTNINNYNEAYRKNPESKIVCHVPISKCKINFPKADTPSFPDEFFRLKKVKDTALWTYVIEDDIKSVEITET